MDEIPDEADGMIVRRGAIDSASRTPFSSGIRPVAPVRREEPVRRAEPARRENLYKQEEPAYQEDNDREKAPAKSSVMDDLVQMATSDDSVLNEELFSETFRSVMLYIFRGCGCS